MDEPRLLVFACSHSDWFHPSADQWRGEAWGIVKKCPTIIFQILTKRPERIADNLPADWGTGYPNAWIGVSVELQQYTARMDVLRRIPCALRFVSAEPQLGPIIWNLDQYGWLIDGGESNPQHPPRPAKPEWFLSNRDQCKSAGVPYYHKQNASLARRPIIRPAQLTKYIRHTNRDGKNRFTRTLIMPYLTNRVSLAYIIGVLSGDGYVTSYRAISHGKPYTSYRVGMNTTEYDFACSFAQALNEIGLNVNVNHTRPRGNSKLPQWSALATSEYFVKWYRDSVARALPSIISKVAAKREFIRGFYESEGGVGTKDHYIHFTNTDRETLVLTQKILNSLGHDFALYGPYDNGDGTMAYKLMSLQTSLQFHRFFQQFNPVIKNPLHEGGSRRCRCHGIWGCNRLDGKIYDAMPDSIRLDEAMRTTHIGWTLRSWNPFYGCSRVSPGCKVCYCLERAMKRLGVPEGEVRRSKTKFYAPLSWQKQLDTIR